MRKLLAVLLFATTIVVCLEPVATACGDKLLVLGRGVKFGNLGPSYHAAIIAYIPESLPESAAVKDVQLQTDLQKAGHIVGLVQQADVLTAAVQSGKYDVILVDMQNAAMVNKQVSSAGVHSVVMPVVYEGADLKPAAGYTCVRKPASGKNKSCLSTIDKAVEAKLKRDEQQRRANKSR